MPRHARGRRRRHAGREPRPAAERCADLAPLSPRRPARCAPLAPGRPWRAGCACCRCESALPLRRGSARRRSLPPRCADSMLAAAAHPLARLAASVRAQRRRFAAQYCLTCRSYLVGWLLRRAVSRVEAGESRVGCAEQGAFAWPHSPAHAALPQSLSSGVRMLHTTTSLRQTSTAHSSLRAARRTDSLCAVITALPARATCARSWAAFCRTAASMVRDAG